MDCNFGPREVFGYSVRATLRFRLVVITLAAVAAAWLWALAPTTTALLYLHPNGWTEADLVRHLWRFRIIQPDWLSSPPQYDYLRWTQAETLARLGLVFLGCLGSAAWMAGCHRRGRAIPPPQNAAAPVG